MINAYVTISFLRFCLVSKYVYSYVFILVNIFCFAVQTTGSTEDTLNNLVQ